MASISRHVARLFFQNILPKHLVNKQLWAAWRVCTLSRDSVFGVLIQTFPMKSMEIMAKVCKIKPPLRFWQGQVLLYISVRLSGDGWMRVLPLDAFWLGFCRPALLQHEENKVLTNYNTMKEIKICFSVHWYNLFRADTCSLHSLKTWV